MISNISIIYALSMLAHDGARAKEPGTVKAGVLVAQEGTNTMGIIRDTAQAFGTGFMAIGMNLVRDDGDAVREVRAMVTAKLAEGQPTIFVLDEANEAPGDMLMRVVRVIDEAPKDHHAVVMALGNARASRDMLAMDVADGMKTSRDRIMGSKAFDEQMNARLTRMD